MNVCMYVCMCMHVHIIWYVCMDKRMSTNVCLYCMYVCMYLCKPGKTPVESQDDLTTFQKEISAGKNTRGKPGIEKSMKS